VPHSACQRSRGRKGHRKDDSDSGSGLSPIRPGRRIRRPDNFRRRTATFPSQKPEDRRMTAAPGSASRPRTGPGLHGSTSDTGGLRATVTSNVDSERAGTTRQRLWVPARSAGFKLRRCRDWVPSATVSETRISVIVPIMIPRPPSPSEPRLVGREFCVEHACPCFEARVGGTMQFAVGGVSPIG
jgi:hypothetical protein